MGHNLDSTNSIFKSGSRVCTKQSISKSNISLDFEMPIWRWVASSPNKRDSKRGIFLGIITLPEPIFTVAPLGNMVQDKSEDRSCAAVIMIRTDSGQQRIILSTLAGLIQVDDDSCE